MTLFAYKGKTPEGKVRQGKIEGRNEQEALSELQQTALIIYELKPIHSVLNRDIQWRKTIRPKEFIIFLRQFASLINAGILLIDALELLAEQTQNPLLKEILEKLTNDVKEGRPLSVAMADYPKVFPELLIQMIQTAEVSGQLEEVLEQMATYYEKQYRLRQKISTAMTYPIVVGVLALLITVFLLIFIVPIFADMLASLDQELPAITKMVLGISGFIQNYWWVFLGLFVLGAFAIQQLKKQKQFRYALDYVQLKIPIFGTFMQKTILARFSQTMSSLLNSSVPILQALDVTNRVIDNQVVKEVITQAREDVEQGESMSRPMQAHWFFPHLIIQMIQVGEISGSLDEMLKKVADIYDQEVEEASEKLQSLIEPLMIVFLAIIVGIIVLSIVVPMFKMFEGLS